MMNAKELRSKLEEIMDMLVSNYSPAQWDAKNEIDLARYHEAKKVYEEAEDAIGLCEIDWSDDPDDEDYDTISQLMDKLSCEIDMMEEDLNI